MQQPGESLTDYVERLEAQAATMQRRIDNLVHAHVKLAEQSERYRKRLRDEFAMVIMGRSGIGADQCYVMADAMMRAREVCHG